MSWGRATQHQVAITYPPALLDWLNYLLEKYDEHTTQLIMARFTMMMTRGEPPESLYDRLN